MEKSIEAIWNDSYSRAVESFRTNDTGSICSKLNIDEEEAMLIDALNGKVDLQIAYIRSINKNAVFKLYNINEHVEECFAVSNMDDWKNLAWRLGAEETGFASSRFLDVYWYMRQHEKGKYRMTIEVENGLEENSENSEKDSQ